MIPNRSLVMSTHKGNLLVFSGLVDWVQNDIVNITSLVGIGSGSLNNTRGLSFIHRQSREIFIFSDADFTTISAINATSPYQQVIIFHIGTSSGVGQLAVDWVSGNCYWVDAVYGWIVMQAIPKDLSRFDSRNPNFKMVVDTYLDIPTGIAVYPELGYLFWTDTGKIPKIERSSLTGKDRKLLVWQGVIWPTSLCIDYSNNRLYWTDPGRGTVECSDLHGNGRNIMVYNPESSFYGIDIFQDVLIVSEWSSGSVNGSIKFFNIANSKQKGFTLIIPKNPVFSLSVYDSRRQPLDISQRCDTMKCQHLCIEKANSTGADCACEDGYMLNPNGLTCEAESQVLQRKIVYTNTNKICFVSINAITSHKYLIPEVGCTVVNSTNNITRFSIDTHKKTFYFTDGHKIYHQIQFSINGSLEVYSTDKAIIDLAYDWITGVLYWFEWDADGGFCYKKTNPFSPNEEFMTTRTKPVTMTFDPYSQKLFWIDSTVRLYNTDTDGRTVNIASSIMKNPTDLEYDWLTDRLVWTDDGFMGRMNSDGTNEKKIYLNNTRTHHSLTVFKNYTIIGYSVAKQPDQAAFTVVLDGDTTKLINFQLSNMTRVDEVKVYDQQLTIEPCERNNGGCEQICIPESSTTCGCFVGYHLNVDGKTCTADIRHEDFILATDSIDHKVYQISSDGNNINSLKMSTGTLPSSIDFDPINQRIVLIDRSDKIIQYFHLSGKEVRAEKKDDISQYSHVAVDVSTGNFYVTFNKTIAVVDPEFDVKTLITTSLTPGKLKVFPKLGQMAWIEGSKIRRAKMDGTEANDFTPKEIITPLDIAFDYEGEALYWCDGNQIGLTKLLTASTEVIVSETGEQPNNIYVAGQYLYYTSFINIRAIYRRNKTKGEDFTTVFESPFVGLASLFVYQNPLSALNKECSDSNGRCCKFCLPLNNRKKCACTDGSWLNDDGRSCYPEKLCPLSIMNGQLEETCLPCYNRHCSFTCNHGFELTVSRPMLKCDSDGKWNHSSVCEPDTPYPVIIGAAVGGFLLVVAVIIIITARYFKRRRSNKVPREMDRMRPPVPVPRADTFKQEELEEDYDYINESTLYNETANDQTPPYIELSESQQDYAKLSEKDTYKRKIVASNRPSKTIHEDYLTPSIAGSLNEGLNDLRVSLPEEDYNGYLRSSSEALRRDSEKSDVSARYQPWDMLEHQARGYHGTRASNQMRYPDGRSFHYDRSQRY
ncbi:hypothetical protein CHS0354_024257 [Potamilus streckersoni]|uniref:Sushi domain-containing protein n=1 Tax=Potamilus streckersoni TaxID=2493646 RepID=A0AAE0VRP1_9BIVA|nr:hypothetical protein CHS0354_024257 [Potamilus streckersoni]